MKTYDLLRLQRPRIWCSGRRYACSDDRREISDSLKAVCTFGHIRPPSCRNRLRGGGHRGFAEDSQRIRGRLGRVQTRSRCTFAAVHIWSAFGLSRPQNGYRRAPLQHRAAGLFARRESARPAVFPCTAANRSLAQKIADHFGIFDGLMANNGAHNLSGKTQVAARSYRPATPAPPCRAARRRLNT
jgi:hypothetical protein